MQTILTAEAASAMSSSELLESYIREVIAGREDSDFVIAARRILTEDELYSADDLEDAIQRALEERERQSAERLGWQAVRKYDARHREILGIGGGY